MTATFDHSGHLVSSSSSDDDSSASISSSPLDRLPYDLLYAVLADLPQQEVRRLRRVCRAWNAAVSSEDFWQAYHLLRPPPRGSSLFLHYPLRGMHSLAWTAPTSSSSSYSIESFPFPPSSPPLFVTDWTAAHGLACLQCPLGGAHPDHVAYFIASRDDTSRWAELPPPPMASRHLAHLWCIGPHPSQTPGFVLALLDPVAACMLLFSSASGSWSVEALPHSCLFSRSSTIIGDSLFTIDLASRSLFTFHLQSRLWRPLDAPLPRDLALSQVWQDSCLIDMVPMILQGPKGKIFLIGSLKSQGSLHWIGVVWELDRSSQAWKEVTRAPLDLWRTLLEEVVQTREPSLISIKYRGEGDSFFIMVSGYHCAIQYSLIGGRWDWLELPSTFNQ